MPSKKRDAPLDLAYLIRARKDAGMKITSIERTILELYDSGLCRISDDGTKFICDIPKVNNDNES